MKHLIIAISFVFAATAGIIAGEAKARSERIRQVEPSPKPVASVAPAVLLSNGFPALYWNSKSAPARDGWTKIVFENLDTLGQDLINSNPSDIKEWCANYGALKVSDRKIFYAEMLSIMVKFESHFDILETYKECSKSKDTYGSKGKWFESEKAYCIPGDASDGGVAISRGLVQMSPKTAKAYGCPVVVGKDLYKVEVNLPCAIRIMNRHVPQPRVVGTKTFGHGVISKKVGDDWKGIAAYWSVLRNPKGKPKESYDTIKKYVNNLPICKAN